MRGKRDCIQVVLGLTMLACCAAFANPYSWNGGDGRWADSGKWTPNGVPGALDSASFLVNAPQTVTIDADTTPFSMSLDTGTAGAGQTFSISPGANLTLDALTLASSQPTAVTITGGGRVALTNEALWVSSTANNTPISFAVYGPGTVLDMPKPAGSGLYIGAKEERYASCDAFFQVTACATVLVANATCIGNVLPRGDGTHFPTRGRLLVDDGSYFYGGAILFIGRGYNGSAGNQCVCAVTNSTLEAKMVDAGEGAAAVFVGSNAVLRAVDTISFPRSSVYARDMRMHFEDSYFTTGVFRVLRASGKGNEGRLARCRVDCKQLIGVSEGARDSVFEIEDSTVHCQEYISTGGNASSNSVLRLVRTETVADLIDIGYSNVLESAVCVEDGSVAIRTMHVGIEKMSKNVRYEQDGGTFSATGAVLVGTYDSKDCSATFRGVDFATKEIICGDALNKNLRSEGPRLTFADMVRCEANRLVVGGASIGACLLLTNTTAYVTYPGTADASTPTIVGKDAGATRNVLLLVDSTLNQTGGNVFVGRNDGATNNTLRLVRSTYKFTTTNSKGDVIVGYTAGAKGNRMELLDHSTFTYDRKWMAVGQNASSNVWSMASGSIVQAPSTTFSVGQNTGAVGNRLELGGDVAFTVGTLTMNYQAAIVVSGTNNTMTLGNDITLTDGCSYLFRPGADASDTPMLTINRAFQYSANRKIYVDVVHAGLGRHVLLTSSSALTEPVAGSSVIFQNVPRNCSAHVSRSADTKSLVCTVALTGTMVIFR